MTLADHVIDELRDLAGLHPQVRAELLAMAQRLQAFQDPDHASQHQAVGLSVCEDCSRSCRGCVLDGWITMKES
jgi:hypothetical protein